MTSLLNLSLGLLFVVITMTALTMYHHHQVLATTENNSDDDDAIKAEMDKRDEQTKEMAETAFLNGTCVESMDKMRILAHPDQDVAILGTEIPTC